MIPPFFIRLKVQKNGSRGINLFLPMFLIYLILLPLVILLIPFWLLFSLFTAGTSRGEMVFAFVPALFKLLCATRGTEVNLEEKDSLIILKIL